MCINRIGLGRTVSSIVGEDDKSHSAESYLIGSVSTKDKLVRELLNYINNLRVGSKEIR